MNVKNKEEKKPIIISIAGSGRSGSTLLSHLCDKVAGCFSAGEVRSLWSFKGEDLYGGSHFCSCGSTFETCEFWNKVISETIGSNIHQFDKIKRLLRSVDRQWFIPSLSTEKLASHKFIDKVNEAVSFLNALYGSIRKISKSDCIIDASGMPSYGFFLNSLPNFDFKVIHLIRDSRAVSYSRIRGKKNKYHSAVKEAILPRSKPWISALDWNCVNICTELLKSKSNGSLIVRYEKFVNNPNSVLTEIIEKMMGLKWPVENISKGEVEINPNHSIGGNFGVISKKGNTIIKADNVWQNKLTPFDKATVKLLTQPLLIKYKKYL